MVGGHTAVLELLLKQEHSIVDISVVDKRGLGVLMWAAYMGRAEAVAMLLAHGVDVNASTSDGDTALTWAHFFEHEAVVDLLLAHGASHSQDERPA